MSSIPNINWNDPNNGKSNTSRQSQPQPQLPSNVSPHSRAVPTSGSIGGPQYGSSQFSNEYSRNPNTIGGPPFPLQLNQRGICQTLVIRYNKRRNREAAINYSRFIPNNNNNNNNHCTSNIRHNL